MTQWLCLTCSLLRLSRISLCAVGLRARPRGRVQAAPWCLELVMLSHDHQNRGVLEPVNGESLHRCFLQPLLIAFMNHINTAW